MQFEAFGSIAKSYSYLLKIVDDHFTADVAAVCSNFVCLRLDSLSEAATQFSAVYPVKTIPCLCLIASTGEVIDVKSGDTSKNDLLEWLSKHSQEHVNSTHDFRPQLSSEPESTSSGPPPTASSMLASPMPTPLEDRTQHARQLVEEKRHERLAQEEIKLRDEEINRRVLGKTMQDFKERQRAREVDEMLLERRKDEAEKRRLRDYLRQQIEDDRRAKQERAGFSGSLDSSPPKIFKADEPKACTRFPKARLQLRFIDGGHVVGCFPTTATLAGEIRNWLQDLAQNNQHGTIDFPCVDDSLRTKLAVLVAQGYRFRQLHPARLFDPEDETRTVADLELCPSAVLVLVPSTSRYPASVQGTAGGLVSRLYSFVSTSLHSVYSYTTWVFYGVWSFGSSFFATARPYSIAPSQLAPTPSSPSSSATSTVSKSGLPVENRSVRRQGNMARLSHLPDDSDDEQARWNGNSTAQL
ncbi:unnamed protein product [Dicrocoelium dendriticum]|nr:unnamed protein product [Dicrocoelium dendriticum]